MTRSIRVTCVHMSVLNQLINEVQSCPPHWVHPKIRQESKTYTSFRFKTPTDTGLDGEKLLLARMMTHDDRHEKEEKKRVGVFGGLGAACWLETSRCAPPDTTGASLQREGLTRIRGIGSYAGNKYASFALSSLTFSTLDAA